MSKPMRLEVVRQRIRLKQYNGRTEKSYMPSVQFHNRDHPCELGNAEIGWMRAGEVLLRRVRIQSKVAIDLYRECYLFEA